jgi:hypothetical protein
VGVWTGSSWLRIGTGGRNLWMRKWTFGFPKMRGISRLAENRLASQEGLCSLELCIQVYTHPTHTCNIIVHSSGKRMHTGKRQRSTRVHVLCLCLGLLVMFKSGKIIVGLFSQLFRNYVGMIKSKSIIFPSWGKDKTFLASNSTNVFGRLKGNLLNPVTRVSTLSVSLVCHFDDIILDSSVRAVLETRLHAVAKRKVSGHRCKMTNRCVKKLVDFY